MSLEDHLRSLLEDALDALAERAEIERGALAGARYSVEPPRRGGSGHVATNAALALARAAGKPPRELGARLAELLGQAPSVESAEVAGPGFVNVKLRPAPFHAILAEVLAAGAGYGRGAAATGERVNVEFVSANPTGPLLISHGRGAVVGDAVARLLEAAGHRVTREYYVNDFGNQVRLLGASVVAKRFGRPPPPGGYGGDYVEEMAAWIAAERPALLPPGDPGESAAPAEELVRECVRLMLEGVPGARSSGIRRTLASLGVEFDVWSSEEALYRWGKVQATLGTLGERGRLRTLDDGAVVFAADGDEDKERVLRKRDGDFTYFASDVAYHADKLARGFDRLIDVWGADHHGYVARVKNALAALGHEPSRLEVLLFQLVSLLREGKPYKMGKRLGNLITIQEVAEEIDQATGNPAAGRDALRFYYLSRRSDTPVELDIELAKKQESENPVFYVQYGHARLCAILRRARDRFGLEVPRFSERLAARVAHPLELELLGQLGRWPATLRESAAVREPHRIVFYLQQLAQDFQSYYTRLRGEGDAILPLERDRIPGWEARWDRDKTLARLLWVEALRTVYASGLGLLGITAPERMTREPRGFESEDEEGATA